jgi:hypothetical protein
LFVVVRILCVGNTKQKKTFISKLLPFHEFIIIRTEQIRKRTEREGEEEADRDHDQKSLEVKRTDHGQGQRTSISDRSTCSPCSYSAGACCVEEDAEEEVEEEEED